MTAKCQFCGTDKLLPAHEDVDHEVERFECGSENISAWGISRSADCYERQIEAMKTTIFTENQLKAARLLNEAEALLETEGAWSNLHSLVGWSPRHYTLKLEHKILKLKEFAESAVENTFFQATLVRREELKVKLKEILNN